MSRVEQFERFRRDARDEGWSIRALAWKHKVHRRSVRQALADPTPSPRTVPVRVAPVLGEHVARVRAWLVADQQVPRKQRHTARRVWQRLVEEEGAVVAESSVRALVAELRREIGATTPPSSARAASRWQTTATTVRLRAICCSITDSTT
ncbi:MAG TPA: hypothetical protein VFQ15_04885 [Jiangellaceae bacterium]|nr:hypothetical protein [Jiangellaceae bacterium]